MNDTLVIYHAGCQDGFTAAWVVHTAHNAIPLDNFYPANYNEEPPYDQVVDNHVYLVDFSYPEEPMREIIRLAKTVTVLDHHKTARDNLQPLFDESLIHGTFDMRRSGAKITWDWFFEGLAPPHALLNVEDRDLWTWKLSTTKDVCNGLALLSMTFDKWDWAMDHRNYSTLFERGNVVTQIRHQDVESIAKRYEWTNCDGIAVPIANCPGFLASEVGHALCDKTGAPFSITYFDDQSKGIRIFSLRSQGDVDVGEIAKQRGGGGHPGAAGYTRPI